MAVFDKVIAHQHPQRASRHQARFSFDGSPREGAAPSSTSRARPPLVALPGHISYGSSKAALDNITRVSALELGPHGIRVNSSQPDRCYDADVGPATRASPEIAGPFLSQMPLGAGRLRHEIAAPIVFLLSDAASMITGVSLPVDGGYSCR